MLQYKLTYRSVERDHVYIRLAKDEESAVEFTPSRVLNGDFDHPVDFAPFEVELIEVEEMEIWAVVQCADSKLLKQKACDQYLRFKAKFEQCGLSATKAVGSYCLEIRGKGDWMESSLMIGCHVLNSNWLGSNRYFTSKP